VSYCNIPSFSSPLRVNLFDPCTSNWPEKTKLRLVQEGGWNMKTIKTLMVMILGLSLLLAAGTAFADGKQRHGGYYDRAYHREKNVYVDRHAYRYPAAPRYAWGYYPAYPYRVYARPVYREYCAPYAPPYAYAPVYAPGWGFAFSFGW
jgi:hypothetical protein